MAKFIKGIHDLIDLLTKKGKTGYHSREDIDLAVYAASKDLFYKEFDIFESTQKISDSLRVFLKEQALTLGSNGRVNIPDDYIYLSALRGGTNGRDIDILTQAAYASRVNDLVCPPSKEDGICVFYANEIEFKPVDLPNIVLTYLKMPVTPKYAYTISNGREVYDDANSIDVEWKSVDHNKITMMALQFLGINLSDPELTNFAAVKSNE